MPRSRAWQEGTSLQQRAQQERKFLQQRRKRLTAKHRDMVRRVIFGMNFVIAELELQETVDYSYPLRDMGYTYGEYEQQARKIRRLVRRAKKKGKSKAVLSDESLRNSEAKTDENLQQSRKAATRSNGRAETATDKNQKKLSLRPG